jgi:hypothetical protein
MIITLYFILADKSFRKSHYNVKMIRNQHF